MIGMNPGEWFRFDEQMAFSLADMKVEFYHLHCYSELVQHQMVGDAYTHVLRTVDVQGTFQDVIIKYINPAYCLPVAKNHIEKLCIVIKRTKLSILPSGRLLWSSNWDLAIDDEMIQSTHDSRRFVSSYESQEVLSPAS